jgi:hypothetical protein
VKAHVASTSTGLSLPSPRGASSLCSVASGLSKGCDPLPGPLDELDPPQWTSHLQVPEAKAKGYSVRPCLSSFIL